MHRSLEGTKAESSRKMLSRSRTGRETFVLKEEDLERPKRLIAEEKTG